MGGDPSIVRIAGPILLAALSSNNSSSDRHRSPLLGLIPAAILAAPIALIVWLIGHALTLII